MKTFCYLRPYNKSQLISLARLIWPKNIIKIFCEHPSIDESGLPKLYYMNLKLKKKNFFNEKMQKDIIQRCRLLRNISKKKAVLHLNAMAYAINDIIEAEKPNNFFLQIVDNYISHIIYLICKKKKINFFGIITSPINNYFRVTSLGRASYNNSYEKNLEKKIYKFYLKKNYVPHFNQKSISSPIKYIIIRWIRSTIKIPFFFLKRILSGDYYNYHSWAQYVISLKHFHYIFPSDPGNKNWEEKLSTGKKNIYIPLQMFPEATIDYACEDLKNIDYYKILFSFIKNQHKKFNIFIKEHPNIVGYRPSKFYDKIKNDRRITIIPTFENSNYILEKIDCVLVWTGTVGFEALIRGIPILTFGKPYYASGKRFLKINQKTSSRIILNHINKFSKKKIKKNESLKIIRYMARQLFKGNYKYHGDWSNKNINDLKDIKIMSNSIKKFIN